MFIFVILIIFITLNIYLNYKKNYKLKIFFKKKNY